MVSNEDKKLILYAVNALQNANLALTPAGKQVVLAMGLASEYGARGEWAPEGLASWNWGATLAEPGKPSFSIAGEGPYGRFKNLSEGLDAFMTRWGFPDTIQAANLGNISATVDAMIDHKYLPILTVETRSDAISLLTENAQRVSEALGEQTLAVEKKKPSLVPAFALGLLGVAFWGVLSTKR